MGATDEHCRKVFDSKHLRMIVAAIRKIDVMLPVRHEAKLLGVDKHSLQKNFVWRRNGTEERNNIRIIAREIPSVSYARC